MCASHDPALRNTLAPALPSMRKIAPNRQPDTAVFGACRNQIPESENRFRAQRWQCKWVLVAPESALESDWPGAGECRASRRWNKMLRMNFVSILIKKPEAAIRIALSPGFFFTACSVLGPDAQACIACTSISKPSWNTSASIVSGIRKRITL